MELKFNYSVGTRIGIGIKTFNGFGIVIVIGI